MAQEPQTRVEYRCSPYHQHSALYKDAEADEDPMRPLDVFEIDGAYFVADGFHRLEAATLAGRTTVHCHVYTGSKRDARVHACLANAHHGLPYDEPDKQRILEWLLTDPEFAAHGDRQLARELGVSHVTVWRTRTRLEAEQRLRDAITTMPAGAPDGIWREQELVAAYLDLPVETVRKSFITSDYAPASPGAIIKQLARVSVDPAATPKQVHASLVHHVEQRAQR